MLLQILFFNYAPKTCFKILKKGLQSNLIFPWRIFSRTPFLGPDARLIQQFVDQARKKEEHVNVSYTKNLERPKPTQ